MWRFRPYKLPLLSYHAVLGQRHLNLHRQLPVSRNLSGKPRRVPPQDTLDARDTDRSGSPEKGGIDPPEEPLFLSAEKGYGYFTCAAVGRRLNRYYFARKLGWARNSTVWLAVDTEADVKTYVSLKLLTANATACIVERLSPEFEVFKKVESADSSHPGFKHCLTLRHFFIAKSSAGGHICFATDVLGSSLQKLRPAGRDTLTVSVAKRVIKQVLLALDYLHRKCGYIHTDLKSDNVLVKLPAQVTPQIDEYLKANPAVVYGPPIDQSPSSLPIVFAESQPLPNFGLSPSLDDISVCIIDYGQATSIEKPVHGDHYQPHILRAPEVILGYPWSSPIDIWTIGCLLFELITDHHLFGEETTYSINMHLQEMVKYLGPFPPRFLKASSRRDDYFNKDGDLRQVTEFTTRSSLEQNLFGLGTVDKEDVLGVAAFMYRCLTLDPASRPSAQELLNDAWLEGV